MKKDITDLMKSYLDGKASADERKRLEEYVSASEENRKKYIDFRRIWEVSHAPFREEDIDKKRAKKKLFAEIGVQEPLLKRFLRCWEIAAAILLLPLAGFTAYLAFAHWGNAVQAGDVILSAPYGSVVRASLPDGTAVCLNSGSSLSYRTIYPTEGRTVKMEGEAYFDVVSDKNNPFTVRLGDGTDVTATGTSFNVNAYAPSVSVLPLLRALWMSGVQAHVTILLPENNWCARIMELNARKPVICLSGYRGKKIYSRLGVTIWHTCSTGFRIFSMSVLKLRTERLRI